MTAVQVHRLTLPAAPSSAGAARRFVDDVLTRADREALAYVATMLVSELVTNAVLHASSELTVVVRLDGAQGRIEVHDRSPQLPMRKHYSALSGTGRGLLMVERVASHWGAEPTSNGKIVWAEFDGRSAAPFGEDGL